MKEKDALQSIATQSPLEDKEVISLSSSALTFLENSKVMTIKDNESLEFAISFIKKIREAKKKVKDKMDFFIKPLEQHVSNIKIQFGNILQPLEKAEQLVNSKILNYRTELEKKLREESQKSKQNDIPWSDEANLQLVGVKPELPKTVRTEVGKVTIRKRFDVEVVDLKALIVSIIGGVMPIEAVEPNMKFLRSLANTGRQDIPGCKIIEKSYTAIS